MNIIGIEKPFSVRGITIVPVIKLSTQYSIEGGIFACGSKQPVAAAIISPSGKKAFRITGEEISIQQLLDEFPAVREKLEEIL
jgi:uncharacterized spore protein YtfJ